MTLALTELERSGAFAAIDIELARALVRLADERSSEVSLAIALASREVQGGHVCLDLRRYAAQPIDESAGDEADAPRYPELARWLSALRASPLISTHELGDPARPLVLDAQGRLYLARYFDHEQRVASLLVQLARASVEAPKLDLELVERLFPSEHGAPDRQREAALAARARRLSVIVGGPGTGKTSTVVKLLALLISDALSLGRTPPRTLLVAPTGKAAQRMSEAIERSRASLPVSELVRAAIATSASTLHRALGPIEGAPHSFRHGPDRPLECDLVLLDEASMVDLALMRRFLDAVPDHARVILLGDPDQLASVEAGGVLYDLCRAAEHPSSPLAPAVSVLTRSHRYAEGSGIAALARAVHRQQPDEMLAVLRSGVSDVTWAGALREGALPRTLERQVREQYAGLKSGDLALRLAALERFRVLAAHRSGPSGVELLNPAIARALGQRRAASASYAGRPIIVTENDYATQLFNGDVGVVHAEGSGRKRALSACFATSDARVRRISIARLPAHDSAYAMTVHKSQGSEFDHVAVILPERPSPLLSRELLYTAITRARRSVTLYANEQALRACVLTRVERSSGLSDRLARP